CWIRRDRAFQSWLRQIKSNVELWSAAPSDDGPLLRGGMLAQGRDWLVQRHDDLSPAERGYIEASLALQRRAEEEQEAARQAEIRRKQELAVQLLAMQARRATAEAYALDDIERGGALALESILLARKLNRPAEADAVEAARSALTGLPL